MLGLATGILAADVGSLSCLKLPRDALITTPPSGGGPDGLHTAV